MTVPLVLAVANHKGGVAKTASTLALGEAAVARGLTVGLIDLDPNCTLTETLDAASEQEARKRRKQAALTLTELVKGELAGDTPPLDPAIVAQVCAASQSHPPGPRRRRIMAASRESPSSASALIV